MSRAARLTQSRVQIQLRVLFALVMREMTTRFGRSPGGYVWAVLSPAGGIALLSLLFSQFARKPPLGDSFALFFATGYVAYHAYMDTWQNLSNAVQVNRALLAFPRVTVLDVILARFILQALTVCFVGVVIIGGLMAAMADPPTLRPGPIFLAMGLALLLAFCVGLLNAVLFVTMPVWDRVFRIVNRPMLLISAVFYIYENMPAPAQALLWWNPLVHVTGIMRTGFHPTYHADYASPVYVIAFSLAPLFLGVLLLRAWKGRIIEG